MQNKKPPTWKLVLGTLMIPVYLFAFYSVYQAVTAPPPMGFVSYDTLNMVDNGMTRDEVFTILGPGYELGDGKGVYTEVWKWRHTEAGREVMIIFRNGLVEGYTPPPRNYAGR
ncbi:MAG: hypothetical protein AAFX06_22435 [Planctomycetota bacterium]